MDVSAEPVISELREYSMRQIRAARRLVVQPNVYRIIIKVGQFVERASKEARTQSPLLEINSIEVPRTAGPKAFKVPMKGRWHLMRSSTTMFRPYQVLQIWYRVRFHPRSFKTYMKN
jgi:hypothetical protein